MRAEPGTRGGGGNRRTEVRRLRTAENLEQPGAGLRRQLVLGKTCGGRYLRGFALIAWLNGVLSSLSAA